MINLDGIGELLKNSRLQRGLSISDVEKDTKIRCKYLEALESGNFEIIPGKIYIKGFIKTYAKYLGIDNEPIILDFLKKELSEPFEHQPIKRTHVEISKGFYKKYVTVILSILALFLLWGVQAFYQYYNEKQVALKASSQSVEINLPVNSPSQNQKPEELVKPLELTLLIEVIDIGSTIEQCWVQVFSDGEIFFEGTLTEGNKKIIKGKEKIKVTLGNAGVVRLSLGEKDLGIPGKVKEVVEKEFTLTDLQ